MFLLLMWLIYFNYAVGPESKVVLILAFVAAIVFKQLRLRKSFWDLPVPGIIFFVFIVYIGLLLTKAPLPQYTLDNVVQSIAILLIYLFIDSLIKGSENVRVWENALIAVVLILATLEFLFFFAWYANWVDISESLFSMPPIGYRLPGIILPSPNFTTGLLNLILPLVLMRFIERQHGAKIMPGILLILIGVIAYFASSRAGWIAGAIAIAVTLLLTYYPALTREWGANKKLLRSISGKVAMLIGVGLAGIFFLANLFIVQSQNTTGHSGVLSGREIIWSNAWKIWSNDLWTGGGPGTFPLNYSRLAGPGTWLTEHAHNIWLHLGAETGLIGLFFWVIAIAWFGLTGVRAWGRLAKRADSRSRIAAYAGIAVGVLVQQQANYLFTTPLYLIFASMLVALYASWIKLPRVQISNLVFYPILAALLIFLVGGTIYRSIGEKNIQEAMEAYKNNNLGKATSLVCESAGDAPQFTVYAFTCGVLNAELFLSNLEQNYLEQSLEITRDGLRRDPFWPVHWANLGILEWNKGEKLAAITAMKRAFEGSPNNALLAVNYGWMAEELNDEQAARYAYQEAIETDPWLMESPFFLSGTELRSEILKQEYNFSVDSSIVNNLHIYQAIKSVDLVGARKLIEDIRDLNQRSPEAWALLGIIDLKEGKLDLAYLHARTAVFLVEMKPKEERNPRIYVWASQVALALAKYQEGASYIEDALSIWIDKVQYGNSLYYYHVYHRPLILHKFVPGFMRADITEEMVSAFKWLVEYYRNEGMATEANEIGLWLAVEGDSFGAR